MPQIDPTTISATPAYIFAHVMLALDMKEYPTIRRALPLSLCRELPFKPNMDYLSLHLNAARSIPPIPLIRCAALLTYPRFIAQPDPTLAIRLIATSHALLHNAIAYGPCALRRLIRFALSLRPIPIPQTLATGFRYPSGKMTNSVNSLFALALREADRRALYHIHDYGKPEIPKTL